MTTVTDGAPEPPAEDLDALVGREVRLQAPDRWVAHDETKIGYEVPLGSNFYIYDAPRPLEVIEADTGQLLAEVTR